MGETDRDPGTEESDVVLPVQTHSSEFLDGSTTPFVVRHDLNGMLTWLTLKPSDTWTVWPDQMSGVTISSEVAEDIASWYGQTPTTTWGVLQIYITDELDGEFAPAEGSVVAPTMNTTIGGHRGVRSDYQDSAGRIDASVAVKLPTGVVYMFDTQVAGAAGAEAVAMRAELDRLLDSVAFVPDSTTEVAWTRSSVIAPSAVGNGFDVAHPTGWIVASFVAGGVKISSPTSPPFSFGQLTLEIVPASADDAARWDSEERGPYYVLRHETRTTSLTGLTTPLSFVPTSAHLMRTGNGATWLVAASNPVTDFGSPGFWLYDQTLYRIVTASMIADGIPPYP